MYHKHNYHNVWILSHLIQIIIILFWSVSIVLLEKSGQFFACFYALMCYYRYEGFLRARSRSAESGHMHFLSAPHLWPPHRHISSWPWSPFTSAMLYYWIKSVSQIFQSHKQNHLLRCYSWPEMMQSIEMLTTQCVSITGHLAGDLWLWKDQPKHYQGWLNWGSGKYIRKKSC